LESLETTHILRLPDNKDGVHDVILHTCSQESAILHEALDKLPWSSLSWSIHWGLRDILVTYSKQTLEGWITTGIV
jgi:hypothetical protein